MKTIFLRLLSLVLLVGNTAFAADTTAPQLMSFSIVPGAVNVSTNSQNITVTLQVTDNESGYLYSNIYLSNPAGDFVVSGYHFGPTPPSLDSTFSITLAVPLYAKPGLWRVDTRLEDAANNVRQIGPGNEPYPVGMTATFTVTNTGFIDTAGPVLTSFATLQNKVFSEDSAAQVLATIHCTDDLSGFKQGGIYVSDPQGNDRFDLFPFFQDTERTSGDAFDGTYSVPITIPQGSVPGVWSLSVFLRDAVGNSSFQSGGTFIVSNNAPHSLGAALDATQYFWSTANPEWNPQTTVTHDGIDAVASGPTDHSKQSTFETTVTGPGVLSFFWRVDSESSADLLSVTVSDTAETHQISGNTAWAPQSVTIPEGAHTVKWSYSKNDSDTQGADRGWVDQVHFTSAADVTAPVLQALRISPRPVNISSGPQNVTFTLEASDDFKGISNGKLRIISPFDATIATLSFDSSQRVSGNALFGTYQMTSQIPTDQGWGNWRVEVDLTEATTTGKTRSYGPTKDAFPKPGEEFFTAWGDTIYDAKAPTVQSISTTPDPVNVRSSAATLTVDMNIADPYQGFSVGSVRAYSPSGIWIDSVDFDRSDVIAGDQHEGTYKAFVRIPQGSETGDWKLYLYLRDEVGNFSYQLCNTFAVVGKVQNSLANALDAAQFVWTTSDPGWAYQTTETTDRIDAASSGTTEDSQAATFQTTITAPGTLSFDWRVDSEDFVDFLSVEIRTENDDLIESETISGNQPWERKSLNLPGNEGPLTVTWRYQKNSSNSAGQDRGWVDQVRFVSSEDASPPFLQALRINPSPVNVWSGSSMVTFMLEVSDDSSGFSHGDLRIIRPSGTVFQTVFFDSEQRLSETEGGGNAQSGTYEVNVLVPDDEEFGTWRVEVDVSDSLHAAPRSYGPTTEPFPNPGEELFTVSNGTASDRQAPFIRSIHISPVLIDIGNASTTATVTLQITDDTSGFIEGDLSVISPSNYWTGGIYFNEGNRISGDRRDGIYSVEIPIPRYGSPGIWKVAAFAIDQAGNHRRYPSDLEFPTTPGSGTEKFTVTNTGSVDTTAPELSSMIITPSVVNTVSGPAVITVRLAISDNLSGFRDRYLWIDDPGGNSTRSIYAGIDDSHLISGNTMNGTYEVQIAIPQGSALGTWQIEVFMRDRAGNTRSYRPGATSYPSGSIGNFNVGPVSVFQSFRNTYQLQGSDASISADPDHDGFNNATELMLGTDPTTPTGGGLGLFSVTQDSNFLHLNFTIHPALTVVAMSDFLELRDSNGGAPFRLTGQRQSGLTDIWTNVLPLPQPSPATSNSYRVSLPFSSGSKGFARLFFED